MLSIIILINQKRLPMLAQIYGNTCENITYALYVINRLTVCAGYGAQCTLYKYPRWSDTVDPVSAIYARPTHVSLTVSPKNTVTVQHFAIYAFPIVTYRHKSRAML